MMPVRIKAIVFDLYGCLVDFSEAAYESMVSEMAIDLDVPAGEFVRVWQDTWGDHERGSYATVEEHISVVCGRIERMPDRAAIHSAAVRHHDFQRAIFVPREGAVDLLSELKFQGYKTASISNCPLETAAIWPDGPFVDVVDLAIFSTEEKIRKPDPAIFQLACDRLGVKGSDCLYVGTGESYELYAASDVGMHGVLLADPIADDDEDVETEPQGWIGLTITDLSAVLNFIELGDELDDFGAN